MPGRLVVMEAEGPLDPQHLLSMLDTDGCGAVVSFVGLTRGTEGEEVVLRLEFDAWKDRLNAVLIRLAKEAMAEHARGEALLKRCRALLDGAETQLRSFDQSATDTSDEDSA